MNPDDVVAIGRQALELTVLLAALTALYTAFLFGQAKGRDLWQSPLLGPEGNVEFLIHLRQERQDVE